MSLPPVTMPIPSDGMPIGHAFGKPKPTPMPGPLRAHGAYPRKLPVAIVHRRHGFIRRVRLWLSSICAGKSLNPVCATCQSSLHYGNDMHQPAWMPYGQVCQGFGTDRVVRMKYDRPRPAPTSLPGPGESRRG